MRVSLSATAGILSALALSPDQGDWFPQAGVSTGRIERVNFAQSRISDRRVVSP